MKSYQYTLQRSLIRFLQFFIIGIIATLSLSSCGGGASSSPGVNNSSHPKFFRNKVTESPRYEPSGEITQRIPTFSWSVTENATDYRFGHESTSDESDWHEYTLTADQAGCHTRGDTCLFIPTDYTFPLYTEKAWWVQAKVNGQWQDWSRPNVFIIVESGGGYTGSIPQPQSPVATVSTLTPEFNWSEVNGAVTYKLGFENSRDYETNGNSWKSHEISASNCHSGVCSFTPSNPGFYQGENVAWWVKAQNSNGSWSDWSEAAQFNISQQQTQIPFIFNVTINPDGVQNPGKDFTINVQETGDYNVDCDSDGNLEAQHVGGNYICQYDNYGTHEITISGLFKGLQLISHSGANLALKKFEVLQWGDSRWASMNYAFANFALKNNAMNVVFSAQDTPNLSTPNIDMSYEFINNHSFNSDISDWDVTHATNMEGMFISASSFNQDIGNWDVSNVTNMTRMFGRASLFNQDIGNWDVSHVIKMTSMFNGASLFNQDIGNWDVSHVTDMSYMFSVARVFNQDIGNWDVSRVTNMSYVFAGASSFNQDIGNWDVSNVTDMNSMFAGASSFNQDISNWDVSNVTDMSSMFSGASAFSQNIDLYDKLLIKWSQLDLRHGVHFGAGNAQYSSAAASARDKLVNDFGWIITDGGQRM